MKIARVLNTNAVLAKDQNDEEIVLLGIGIGFKHRVGDDVEEHKIEKRFVLKDKKYQNHFQELLGSISQEYIMVAEQIISLGVELHHMELNESIHISLADHIHTAVDNFKNNILLPNSLLLDIRQFYQNEYEVAKQGLTLIKAAFGCEFPDDEAGYIAMHFVNAQYGKENMNIKKTIQFVKEVNSIVFRELGTSVDENSLSYYRYMTHLKFFAQRVMTDYHYSDGTGSIFDALLIQYRKEYACARKIEKFVKEKYNYKVGRDEMLYLTVHLSHLTQK